MWGNIYYQVEEQKRDNLKGYIEIWSWFSGSLSSINFPRWVVTVRSSADQQGSIAPHEAKGKPLEQVLGGLALLLASVSCQGSGQHLGLPDGHPVHPPKCFPGKREEGKTLLPTCFGRPLHLPVVGLVQGWGRFPRVFGDKFGEEFCDKFGDEFSESPNLVIN